MEATSELPLALGRRHYCEQLVPRAIAGWLALGWVCAVRDVSAPVGICSRVARLPPVPAGGYPIAILSPPGITDTATRAHREQAARLGACAAARARQERPSSPDRHQAPLRSMHGKNVQASPSTSTSAAPMTSIHIQERNVLTCLAPVQARRTDKIRRAARRRYRSRVSLLRDELEASPCSSSTACILSSSSVAPSAGCCCCCCFCGRGVGSEAAISGTYCIMRSEVTINKLRHLHRLPRLHAVTGARPVWVCACVGWNDDQTGPDRTGLCLIRQGF